MLHKQFHIYAPEPWLIGQAAGESDVAIASLPPIAGITEAAKPAAAIVDNSPAEEKSEKSSPSTASHSAARASRNSAAPLQQIAKTCPDGVSAHDSAKAIKAPRHCEQLQLSAMMNDDVCGCSSTVERQLPKQIRVFQNTSFSREIQQFDE